MIKLKILGGRIYLGLSGWALNPMTRPHKDETEGNLTDVEAVKPQRQRLGECGHKSRNADSQKQEEVKNGFYRRASRGSAALPNFWPPKQKE